MLPHRSVSERAPLPAICRPHRASDSRVPDGAGWCCTTKQHNAHGTEAREVFYPWHPWFGRVVHVHEMVRRGNMPVFWCSPTADRTGRCLEVPSWMFDRAACLHLCLAEAPQVDRAALDNVKMLLSGTADRVSPARSVIGARHSSHESRGDAD